MVLRWNACNLLKKSIECKMQYCVILCYERVPSLNSIEFKCLGLSIHLCLQLRIIVVFLDKTRAFQNMGHYFTVRT